MTEKEISDKLKGLSEDQLEEVNRLVDKLLVAHKPEAAGNLAQIIEKFHIPKNYQLAIIEHSNDFSLDCAPVIIWNADNRFHILNVLEPSLLGQIDLSLDDITEIIYCQKGCRHPVKAEMFNFGELKTFKDDFCKFARDYSVCTFARHTYISEGGEDLLKIDGRYKIEFTPPSLGSLIKILDKPIRFKFAEVSSSELSPSLDTDIFKLMTFHQYFVVDDLKYNSEKDKLIHRYCDLLTDINEIKKNVHMAFDKKMLTEQEANDYLQEYLDRLSEKS